MSLSFVSLLSCLLASGKSQFTTFTVKLILQRTIWLTLVILLILVFTFSILQMLLFSTG
ncbi:hypothetical protein LINPERHAP2_LOCUS17086 [Linum perenne]